MARLGRRQPFKPKLATFNLFTASGETQGSSSLQLSGTATLTAVGNLTGASALEFGHGSSTSNGLGSLLGTSALTVSAQLVTNTSSVTASPSTVIDDNSNSGERSWANPENVVSSNNQYANTTGTGGLKLTNRLRATNFGLSLPPGAVVDRIKFRIEKFASSLDGVTEDQEVRLVIAGTVSGNNKAIAGNWSDVEGYVTYDYTPSDWGVTVVGADLNDTDFGVVLAANIDGDVDTAYVDHFELTVYYTVSVIAGFSDLTFGSGSSTLIATGVMTASSDLVIGSNVFGSTLNPITGTAALTLAASGALQTTARSDLVFTAVATLTATGELSGQADIVFSASVPVVGSLTGTADITIGAASVASSIGSLVGTSQITLSPASTLIATGILVGSSDLVFGTSASLAAQANITGLATLTIQAVGEGGGGALLLRMQEEGLFVGLSL